MLKAVAEILERRGTDGWLVGGSVRDRLMGRYSPDLDIVVADDAAAVAKELAAALQAPWFGLSERHPTYRVLGAGGHVDVAAVRGDIFTDLGMRDFTVNAMAVTVASATGGEGSGAFARRRGALGAPVPDYPVPGAAGMGAVPILDPFGGLAHLGERRLVAVSEAIFVDDPLRLMRAPRLCHTLGLRLDEDLVLKVREQAAAVTGAAAERIVSEMCLAFAAGRAAAAVRLWDDSGLLTVVLPELRAGTRSGSGGAPGSGVESEGGEPANCATVWRGRSATLSLLERLDDMLGQPVEHFPEAGEVLGARLAQPVDGAIERSVALRWAGLTYGLAVQDVRALSRRLKLSGAMDSLLGAIARISAPRAARADEVECTRALAELLPGHAAVSRSAVLFLWDAAPWEPEAIMLTAAAEGGQGATLVAARRLLSLYARRAGGGMPSLPVDGDALMRELGLKPGPMLGRALREARLAWEAGEARTAGEALAAARGALTPR